MKLIAASVLLALASSAVAVGPGTKAQILYADDDESGPLRCLVVPSNTDGAQVNLIPCPRDLTPNTTFTLTAGSAPQDGADFARGPVTQLQIYGDKCVDVTDGVNAEGTALQIWTCDAQNGNPNQRFNVNEKFFMYEIEWAAHGLCAGVGNKKDPNAPITLQTCDPDNSDFYTSNLVYRLFEED